MSNQESRLAVYKEVSSLPLSPLDPEHFLVKAGFSPNLPQHYQRLNRCLSLLFEPQLKAMYLDFIPDPERPKLTMESEYTEERKIRLGVYPNGRAMFKIVGKAPGEQLPDIISVVDLLDMQNLVEHSFPGADAELFWLPRSEHLGDTSGQVTLSYFESAPEKKEMAVKETIREPISIDFLSLTQRELDNLEPNFYTLLVGREHRKTPVASILPFIARENARDKIKLEITAFRYAGKSQDVERTMLEFIDILERNLPGSQPHNTAPYA